MTIAGASPKVQAGPELSLERYQDAVSAAERLLHLARAGVRKSVDTAGGLDAVQAAAHGLAWLATYVESLRQMLGWARRLEGAERLSEMERLVTTAAFGEYLAQIAGGIPMSQNETVRPAALGVPQAVLDKLSALGVFALTLPEAFGGLGLGKEAMCVVSEELSRGYIGVGSLGTRSEIAAELILGAGTEAQQKKYLPKIASGEILP